jgi:hypothetical protein
LAATIGIEVQALGLLRRERGADDARGVADHERHLFRRAQGGGDEQVALVLAVVVVGDHHDLAARKGGDQLFHALMIVGHAACLPCTLPSLPPLSTP